VTSDVIRPVAPGQWAVEARSVKVAEAWQQWATSEPAALQRVYDQLQADPLARSSRQVPLAGPLGTGTFDGVSLPRWQFEVTAGGRLLYLVDDAPFGQGKKRRAGRVIIDVVSAGHPKETEQKQAGKRRPGRR